MHVTNISNLGWLWTLCLEIIIVIFIVSPSIILSPSHILKCVCSVFIYLLDLWHGLLFILHETFKMLTRSRLLYFGLAITTSLRKTISQNSVNNIFKLVDFNHVLYWIDTVVAYVDYSFLIDLSLDYMA